MKKWKKIATILLSSTVLLAACGNSDSGANEESDSAENNSDSKQEVTIGVVGDIEREVWEDVAERLEADEGIKLEVKVFDDYVQPNTALEDGSLDLNAFQHLAFLNDFVQSSDADVTPVGYTYVSPMAAYSEKVTDLANLEDGAEVVIPNDATNGGRALLLLELAGVIEVDDETGISPTVNDVTKNDKNIKFTEVDAAQVPRSLADADAVIANTNYAVDAGLSPSEDGIFVDTDDLNDVGAQYKNAIVVKTADKDADWVNKVVAAYQSEETEEKIKEVSDGADQKAWTDDDDIAADFEEVQNNAKE